MKPEQSGVYWTQALGRERENPRTLPVVPAHTIAAYDRETNRPVRVAPLVVPPGEKAPINLQYGGRTATAYVQDCLMGAVEWYAECDRNLTPYAVIVYHGIWANTGNNAGYFRPEHLRFAEQRDE